MYNINPLKLIILFIITIIPLALIAFISFNPIQTQKSTVRIVSNTVPTLTSSQTTNIYSNLNNFKVLKTTTVTVENKFKQNYTLTAWEALTQDEQAKGLMFVKNLPDTKGMIFIFDSAQTQTFWMKNTLSPLEIIFIDENNKIINIVQADTCKTDNCPTYSSTAPAKYVLEVIQGWAKARDINPGDTVQFQP